MTQSEIRDAEFERMQVLDERLQILERKLSARPKSCLGSVWENICTVVRSIPILSIMAMVTSGFGLNMMYENYEPLSQLAECNNDANKTAHCLFSVGNTEQDLTSYLLRAGIFILGVDVAALFVSFPATGAFREYVFGRVHGGCMLCLMCLAGPCCMTIILVGLFAAFFGTYGAVQTMVLATQFLSYSIGVCDAEDAKKAMFEKIITNALMNNRTKVEISLDRICSKDAVQEHYVASAMLFTLGLILTTLGQVYQLVTHTNNLEKVWNQEDLDDSLQKEIVYDYFKTHEFKGNPILDPA